MDKKVATHNIEEGERVIIWYDPIAGHYWITPSREYHKRQHFQKAIGTKVKGSG